MAVETMTIDTLVYRVYFAISNVSVSAIANVDANVKTEIKWALHCALRELVERTVHSSFRVIGSISAVASTKTYALPDDFHQEIEDGVKFAASDFRTLKYLSEQQYDEWQLDSHTNTADPTHYMIRGRSSTTSAAQMTFWPTPSANRTITINYLAFPVKLYDLADASVIDRRIPPEYHHTLVSGALRHLPRYISDADWQKHMALWEMFIKEAQKKSTQVSGQVYQRDMYDSGPGLVGLGRVPETLTGSSL